MSHLPQGLKLVNYIDIAHISVSHLPQVRGLKPGNHPPVEVDTKSHLPQVRGLKRIHWPHWGQASGRTSRRCVD